MCSLAFSLILLLFRTVLCHSWELLDSDWLHSGLYQWISELFHCYVFERKKKKKREKSMSRKILHCVSVLTLVLPPPPEFIMVYRFSLELLESERRWSNMLSYCCCFQLISGYGRGEYGRDLQGLGRFLGFLGVLLPEDPTENSTNFQFASTKSWPWTNLAQIVCIKSSLY